MPRFRKIESNQANLSAAIHERDALKRELSQSQALLRYHQFIPIVIFHNKNLTASGREKGSILDDVISTLPHDQAETIKRNT